jgi:hypothetical protein
MILDVVRGQVMDGGVTYDQLHAMDFLKWFVIQRIPSVKLAVFTENIWIFEFVICICKLSLGIFRSSCGPFGTDGICR